MKIFDEALVDHAGSVFVSVITMSRHDHRKKMVGRAGLEPTTPCV